MPSPSPPAGPRGRGAAAFVRLLRCPVCGARVAGDGGGLGCERGHRFDVARQGYVTLVAGRAPRSAGDTAEMVAARARFLGAGHYEPLAERLAGAAGGAAARAGGDGDLVELGAGTGYYAARALERLPGAVGVALDTSKPAARRAARAHPRLGAVVADAAGPLPIRTGAAAVALTVFAPWDAGELARVLDARGAWLVASPTPRHLRELIEPLGLLRVGADKEARRRERARPHLELAACEELEIELSLAPSEVADLVRMGPSAFHLAPGELEARMARLPEAPIPVTASFAIERFEPAAGAPGRGGAARARTGGRRRRRAPF